MQEFYISQPNDRQEFETMLRQVKREFNKSGIARELKIQAIPKRSERVREKRRLSRMRKGRTKGRMIAGDNGDGRAPGSSPLQDWKFLKTGPGECVRKIIPRRKEKMGEVKGYGPSVPLELTLNNRAVKHAHMTVSPVQNRYCSPVRG